MSSPLSIRQAGLASIIAAALILISQATQLIFPMVLPESFWNATQTLRLGLAMVAMFALLIALTGLYSSQRPTIGRLGLVGYMAASFGTLLVAGDWWYEAFVGPMLLVEAPELLATAPSGSILVGAFLTAGSFAAGWLIFGVASFRARVLPRGAAVLMAVGGLSGMLALIAPFQVPLALAVGWMGIWLVRADAPEHQPATWTAPATV